MVEYHCPKCFHIPIYDVQTDFQTMEIKCINGHIFKYKISEFFHQNPFVKKDIICHDCPIEEKKVNDLYYCIDCKVHTCFHHKFQSHNICKNVIQLENKNCTCLEHNSPFSTFCKNCNKEICNYCILGSHRDHTTSEDFPSILQNILFLSKNERIEKYLIEKLISENDYINEDKKVYNILIKLLSFVNDIFYKETSNQRFSNIIYINIVILHDALNKFKKCIKPNIERCLKTKNENIKDEKSLKKFLSSCYSFSNEIINKPCICLIFHRNSFLCTYSKSIGLMKHVIVAKILRNNKISEIELNLENIIYKDSIVITTASKEDSDNNSFLTKKNVLNTLSSFSSIFKKRNKYAYSSRNLFFINSNDFIFPYEKEEFFSLHLNFSNRKDYYKLKNRKEGIILNDNYFLLLIIYFNPLDRYIFPKLEEKWLILINPKNEVKKLLTIKKCSGDLSIQLIHKNIFLIYQTTNVTLCFFEFFEKNEEIQLICKHKLDKEIQYIKAFEFNKNYCIFSTHNELMFYNWRKNEIVRRFFVNRFEIIDLINVNKYNFIGICNGISEGNFFVYNLIDNTVKIFLGPSGFDEIISLYNNYFVVFDEYHKHFSLINISEKGITYIN